MRPGQLTPENDDHDRERGEIERASMRPGQLTPENLKWVINIDLRCVRFNEAGAINPGKRFLPRRPLRQKLRASMRPGQLTPENRATAGCTARRSGGFNEAGAINPGKRRLRALHSEFRAALQ